MSVASVSQKEPAGLADVISAADGINHAIPTHQELQQALGHLQHLGLVVKENRRYSLTATGSDLIRAASSKRSRMHDVLQELSSHLPDCAEGLHRDEEVTPEDAQSASVAYRKQFREQYRKLKGNG